MKTILWHSKSFQQTDELKEYLDKLIQEYDIITIVPTRYGGLYGFLLETAIIIVKDKEQTK